MTTTTITDLPLIPELLRALRNADTAVLTFEREDFGHMGTIRLTKEVETTHGFGPETRTVEIPTRVIVSNYGSSGHPSWPLDPAVSGSWVLLSLRFRPEWATLVSLLRAGDVLVQEWVVDNRNVLLAEAGLTSHELKLRIERPAKGGRVKLLSFMLDQINQRPGNPSENVRRERRATEEGKR